MPHARQMQEDPSLGATVSPNAQGETLAQRAAAVATQRQGKGVDTIELGEGVKSDDVENKSVSSSGSDGEEVQSDGPSLGGDSTSSTTFQAASHPPHAESDPIVESTSAAAATSYSPIRQRPRRRPRRSTVELEAYERWTCPRGCGRVYRKNSTVSIRKHMPFCQGPPIQHVAFMPMMYAPAQPPSTTSQAPTFTSVTTVPMQTLPSSELTFAPSLPLMTPLTGMSALRRSDQLHAMRQEQHRQAFQQGLYQAPPTMQLMQPSAITTTHTMYTHPQHAYSGVMPPPHMVQAPLQTHAALQHQVASLQTQQQEQMRLLHAQQQVQMQMQMQQQQQQMQMQYQHQQQSQYQLQQHHIQYAPPPQTLYVPVDSTAADPSSSFSPLLTLAGLVSAAPALASAGPSSGASSPSNAKKSSAFKPVVRSG